MCTEDYAGEHKYGRTKVIHRGGGSEAIFGLGFIGAAIYFIGTATTFGMGVLGFLKAMVWPVFVVHALLKFLEL